MIEFEIPFWVLLLSWLSIKVAAAVFMQLCFVKTRQVSQRSGMGELKSLAKHFALSFLLYPEMTLVWACLWPVFAAITWRWHPKYILPGVVIEYLEKRDV